MSGAPLRGIVVSVVIGGCVATQAVILPSNPPIRVSAAAVRANVLGPVGASARLDPDTLLRSPELLEPPEPPPAPIPSATPPPVALVQRPPSHEPVPPPPPITAESGLLLDADAGRILWARNAQALRPMASVAKIFTAMVAVNLMPLDRPITVPASVTALPWDSTLMGLTPGETLSVQELLDGTLLVSGNDAAVTLAQGSTSQATFVADMNALAARIGLHSTHFVNPVGLDDPTQYSSAADLAAAAIYLDRNYPLLAGIAATIEIDLPQTAAHKAFKLQNLDELIWTYPGVNGLKGGYTDLAGGCLLTTATLAGHRIVAVLLGSPPLPAPGAFADMRALLDFGAAVIRS